MKPISKNKKTLLAAACLIVLHCLIPGGERGALIGSLLTWNRSSYHMYSSESRWISTAGRLDTILGWSDFQVLPAGPYVLTHYYPHGNGKLSAPSGLPEHDGPIEDTLLAQSLSSLHGSLLLLYYMPIGQTGGTSSLHMATLVDMRLIHITGIPWILRTPGDAPDLSIIRLDHIGYPYVGVFRGLDNVFVGKDEKDLRDYISQLEVFAP